MPARRLLSVWFPRLAAERLLRRAGDMALRPFATVAEDGGRSVLASLSLEAEAMGLRRGQPLREARALCPDLRTQTQDPVAEAAFLRALGRWAERFSPLVGIDGEAGLMLDITGCAHLFGGEADVLRMVGQEAAGLGLSTRCGLADTVGAAWALARFAGQGAGPGRSGDEIDQEARATRSRAARRRPWEQGGIPPRAQGRTEAGQIAPEGQLHSVLAPLPVAALRLSETVVQDLGRLGLRRIGDLVGQPRAALGRRFGPELMLRLDQALGLVPEPLSPAAPLPCLATRLSLPEPIGLQDDLRAGLERLATRLCQLLRDKGLGARHLRFEVFRTDGSHQAVDLRLARPADRPDVLLPLFAMRLEAITAGFGIDRLRLEAVATDPVPPQQSESRLEALRGAGDVSGALADLITRLGTRIGLEAITRRHPAESPIPEKSALILPAAWSDPAKAPWPVPALPRPLLLWRPEPVGDAPGDPPVHLFRWRGRVHEMAGALGPERIAPEWWLEDPDWRTGLRDYWQVVTTRGERLWLFHAHGAQLSGGWFCQGRFG